MGKLNNLLCKASVSALWAVSATTWKNVQIAKKYNLR